MLKKLYIELSSNCNLNCKMCFRNNWFDESYGLMSDFTVDRIKNEIKTGKFTTVFFGGMGEPLMHPALCGLVSTAHSCGKTVELITNATLLSREMSQKLAEAGLDCLWISMDGFSKESYEKIRRGSLFDRITDNIKAFNSVRGKTKLGLTFVMQRENEHELQSINAFADKVGADIINLSHAVPESPIEESEVIYEKNYPVGKMKRFSFTNEPKLRDTCPFITEGSCFIKWDGSISPCMQLLHNCYTYLYTEKRKNYFKSYGNINTESLGTVWNSEEFVGFRQRVVNFDFPCCTVCLGCDDRLENITDCMYNESPTCGACLWAQGYIRCP